MPLIKRGQLRRSPNTLKIERSKAAGTIEDTNGIGTIFAIALWFYVGTSLVMLAMGIGELGFAAIGIILLWGFMVFTAAIVVKGIIAICSVKGELADQDLIGDEIWNRLKEAAGKIIAAQSSDEKQEALRGMATVLQNDLKYEVM
jgi:hypothetical protein